MEWGRAAPGTAMRIYIIPLGSFCQFDLNLEAQKAQLEGSDVEILVVTLSMSF